MRIVSIGGGPAGLYFAILMKKAFPACDITVFERNRPTDAFGWGVVFSDETLSNFEEADPESFAAIREQFATWGDIETYVGGECVRSTGHGFCGLSRKRMLEILHARCVALGVKLVFEREVAGVEEFADADLILAADGINSAVRTKHAEHFKPTIEWGRCKFTWLGTTKELRAFTFIFRDTEHGLFQVHAYPFEKDLSTFIVECREETWRRAGLDKADEPATVAYFERLFADHLGGHRLLTNRSLWRSFPTVRCETWHWKNVVLVGDAAHTAHFSIGSGTKLAMEDSIALAAKFRELGTGDVPAVLRAYEEARFVDVAKTQRAAQTSLEWFESSARYLEQPPVQFTLNLMTRSRRITYDNLRKRDPVLVQRATEWFAESAGVPRMSTGAAPAPMFAPFRLRDLELSNRVVVSPMCQYSSADGAPNEWHLVHLGSRAIGGASLVFTEMTDVSEEGRITYGCAGIYRDEHVDAWKRIVEFVHRHSRAKIGMQIAHAGRKGSCNLPWEGDDPLRDGRAWKTLAPSAIPFDEGWPAPRAMELADMERVAGEFARAAQRAERAGFDAIELHMAHGYLLSSFLSPLANRREDAYGGTLANRMRFPLEVFDAVRAAWPARKPIFVRLTATDWLDDEGGFTPAEAVDVAKALKARGCDCIDVSTGGNTPRSKPQYGRMYQVPFAEKIRHEARMPVMTVGGVQGADHVNTIVASGRADLCAIARGHLVNPYITLGATFTYGHVDWPWPNQYLPAKPR